MKKILNVFCVLILLIVIIVQLYFINLFVKKDKIISILDKVDFYTSYIYRDKEKNLIIKRKNNILYKEDGEEIAYEDLNIGKYVVILENYYEEYDYIGTQSRMEDVFWRNDMLKNELELVNFFNVKIKKVKYNEKKCYKLELEKDTYIIDEEKGFIYKINENEFEYELLENTDLEMPNKDKYKGYNYIKKSEKIEVETGTI